jgi:hypothetical protein
VAYRVTIFPEDCTVSPSPASVSAVRLPALSLKVALLLSALAPLCGASLEALSPPVGEALLVVPRFEVDTTSRTGTTTLFALRNPTDESTSVSVAYIGEDGSLLGEARRNLEPHQVWTVNLRDVDGLAVDDDGFARGWVDVYASGSTTSAPVVVGDWFQVDVEQGFATADPMPPFVGCRASSLRFLDFGGGMELTVFGALGPTYTVEVFDQTGAPVGEPRVVETTGISSRLKLSDLTSVRFGTLAFDFTPAGEGHVFGHYRAEGRFSVSLPAVCEGDDTAKLSPPPPQTTLFLPRYTVDTRSATGETTLIAVRSLVDEPVTANIFFTPATDPLAAFGKQMDLAPRQVRSINLRDLDGLPVDEEGIARGSMTVEAYGPAVDRPLVTGDSLQVDPAGDFATGDLLHPDSDLCPRASVRFVDFEGRGDGARFVIWLRRPPTERFAPAFTVRTYDEAGRPVGEPFPVIADGPVMELSLAQITTARFGSLAFDFSASGGGLALGRYSAEGRFSVALGSVCQGTP